MNDWLDEEARKEKESNLRQAIASASTERREVWVTSALAALEFGREAEDAIVTARRILKGFDEDFPEILLVASSTVPNGGEPENDDEPEDEPE